MKTTSAHRWLISLRRAVAWHRRKLAVVAMAAAVLCSLGALVPAPPVSVPVVRTTTPVRGGTVLTLDHIQVDRAPPELVPVGAFSDVGQLAGRIAAGPLSAGQMLTPDVLMDARPRLANGKVLAPVRLADEQVVGLLREGMVVDVLAADARSASAAAVASQVRIAAVPPPAEESVRAPDGGLILVEVTTTVASALARAAVVSQLSVVWR